MKCIPPYVGQPIVEDRSRQPCLTGECATLDQPDSGGYADAYEGTASFKCILPNLLQPVEATY